MIDRPLRAMGRVRVQELHRQAPAPHAAEHLLEHPLQVPAFVEDASILRALAQTECELPHTFPSTLPSAKCSCSGSAVRPANGNTAIVGLPASQFRPADFSASFLWHQPELAVGGSRTSPARRTPEVRPFRSFVAAQVGRLRLTVAFGCGGREPIQ